MPAVQKVCCLCGDDVSAKKRVKDAKGRYYCEPCQAKAVQARSHPAKEPAVATLAASARSSPPAAVAAPPAADDGMLDLAPVGDHGPPKDTPMFGCSACKRLVPEKQIRNIDGEFICNVCFSKRNQARNASPASSRTKNESKGGMPQILWWGIGAIVLVGGMIGAGFLMPEISHKIFGGVAIVGIILFVLGNVWGLWAATEDNVGLRMACRFIPFLATIIIIHRSISDWEEMKAPIYTMGTGLAIALFGGFFWSGILFGHVAPL